MTFVKDPFFIGFDDFLFNRTSYPPYDIIKETDSSFRIELAVAGYSKENLEVTLENSLLTIKGSKVKQKEQTYLHNGISKKSINISFTLASDIVVSKVELVEGVLTILLNKVIPEENKPKLIPIL
jgi:molecular chaperone IbpA